MLIDGGCKVEGYSSDVTRTGILGKPSEKIQRTYEIVRKAQDAALDDVTACGERLLEAADEDAEVRVGRPRVHLRDEQDLHARVG